MDINIIAGHMRSGTSFTAGMLRATDLIYGGANAQFVPPSEVDPKSIHETRLFKGINNQILTHIGADWVDSERAQRAINVDWFPYFKNNQAENIRVRAEVVFSNLVQQARRLNKEAVFWKDPRNSLTLPFWLHLIYRSRQRIEIDNIRVLWCYRDPNEVSKSAASIGYGGIEDVEYYWNLWHIYNAGFDKFKNIFSDTSFILVHYNRFVREHRKKTTRLMNYLKIDSKAAIERAQATFDKELYRHKNNQASKSRQSQLYHELTNSRNNL